MKEQKPWEQGEMDDLEDLEEFDDLKELEAFSNMTEEELEEYTAKEQARYSRMIDILESIPKGERFRMDTGEGEVDEMIYPAIEALNEKGYFTLYSCSGHFNRKDENTPYIDFDPEVSADCFSSMPEGFTLKTVTLGRFRRLTEEELRQGYTLQTERFDTCQLFHELSEADPRRRFLEILTANAALLKWAINLPDRNP